MVKVIGVRFKTAGKVYYFDPGELELEIGSNDSRRGQYRCAAQKNCQSGLRGGLQTASGKCQEEGKGDGALPRKNR